LIFANHFRIYGDATLVKDLETGANLLNFTQSTAAPIEHYVFQSALLTVIYETNSRMAYVLFQPYQQEGRFFVIYQTLIKASVQPQLDG
jgi:hypothetical protein